jgi:sensor domain CHASE-containing protein
LLWLAGLGLLLGTVALPAQAADSVIERLRIEQQKQLDALQAQYHAKVRGNLNLVKPDGTIDTSHPDYQKTLSDYAADKAKIQTTFSGQDPRGAEH